MFECHLRQNASMSWLDNRVRPNRDHGFLVEKLHASERLFRNNVLLSALRISDRRSPRPYPAQLPSVHTRNGYLCHTIWPIRSNDVPAESLHPPDLVPTRLVCILNQTPHEDVFPSPYEPLLQFGN
jgi:hypothetical protein